MPTLGAGFKTKEVSFQDDDNETRSVRLNLWDTAGQEKFDTLTKMYFRGAQAALIVYDVTEEFSFEKAKKWVKDLNDTEAHESLTIVKALVGNKSDNVEEKVVSS